MMTGSGSGSAVAGGLARHIPVLGRRAVEYLAVRDGGVYLELETIGLSRDMPASLRWLVKSIVRRVSRWSLSTTLRQTEIGVRSRAALANGKKGSGGSNAAIAPGVTAG